MLPTLTQALSATTAKTIQGTKPVAAFTDATSTANAYFGLSPDGGSTKLYASMMVAVSSKSPSDYSVVETSGGIPTAEYTFTDTDGDTDAGMAISVPTLKWQKWDTLSSSWSDLSDSEKTTSFTALESGGITKLKAIIGATTYPTSEYGDPSEGDPLSLGREIIVFPSDGLDSIKTKYHKNIDGSDLANYAINVGFPKTGFYGAEFQLVLKTQEPSLYTWELDSSGSGTTENALAKLDESGNIILKGRGELKIFATGKAGTNAGNYTYTVDPDKWFEFSENGLNLHNAAVHCKGLGNRYRLPTRSEVSNYAQIANYPVYYGQSSSTWADPANTLTTGSYSRNATDASLLSEWGSYGNFFKGKIWSIEPFTTSRGYYVDLSNGRFGSENSGNDELSAIYGGTSFQVENHVLCVVDKGNAVVGDSIKGFTNQGGRSFGVNDGFPATGFWGAGFTTELTTGNQSDYYWYTTTSIWRTEPAGSGIYTMWEESLANVWIIGIGKPDGNKSGQVVEHNFSTKMIFKRAGGTLNAMGSHLAAAIECQNLGDKWRLPQASELTNQLGLSVAATQSVNNLMGEWGSVYDNYTASGVHRLGTGTWTMDQIDQDHAYIVDHYGQILERSVNDSTVPSYCIYNSNDADRISASNTGTITTSQSRIQVYGDGNSEYKNRVDSYTVASGAFPDVAPQYITFKMGGTADTWQSSFNWYTANSNNMTVDSDGAAKFTTWGSSAGTTIYGIGRDGSYKGTVVRYDYKTPSMWPRAIAQTEWDSWLQDLNACKVTGGGTRLGTIAEARKAYRGFYIDNSNPIPLTSRWSTSDKADDDGQYLWVNALGTGWEGTIIVGQSDRRDAHYFVCF